MQSEKNPLEGAPGPHEGDGPPLEGGGGGPHEQVSRTDTHRDTPILLCSEIMTIWTVELCS